MKTITCRVTVKKHIEGRNVKLAQYETYGIMEDVRHIVTAEGHKFTAGRKAGFGKTGTWELENDHSGLSEIEGYTTKYVSVHIDRIQEYVEE